MTLQIFKEDAYNFGFSAGEEYGRNEGISYGEHKKAIETAKIMKSEDMSAVMISHFTGLSIEEIEKLQ